MNRIELSTTVGTFTMTPPWNISEAKRAMIFHQVPKPEMKIAMQKIRLAAKTLKNNGVTADFKRQLIEAENVTETIEA